MKCICWLFIYFGFHAELIHTLTHRIVPNRKYNKVFPNHVMRTYRGSSVIAPIILYLGTRLRGVVNFTPRQLHSRIITPVPNEQ
jgi:hypothetical protein